MRSLGRTLLALLAAVAFAGWGAPPRRLHAHAPDATAVVQAYTAAWNAHDVPAVLARFAPDAEVRERRGAVPPAVWNSRDPQTLQAYLDGSHGDLTDPQVLTWALGQREIAAWAAARFAQHHRCAAGPYRAAGDTARWPYQEFIAPSPFLPGVGPLEGEAEAVVRGGRIITLTLVVSPESVQRRHGEVQASAARVAATRYAAPLGAGSSGPPSGPPYGRAPSEPESAAWPLALGASRSSPR